jgi:FlaA1/EpsC-like NDP-sugar epimerase
MPSIRILDLAEILVQYLAPILLKDPNKIKIITTQKQQSEKLFEELITLHESERSLEFEDYYCILPTVKNTNLINYTTENSKTVTSEISSENSIHLTKQEILDFLLKNKLI